MAAADPSYPAAEPEAGAEPPVSMRERRAVAGLVLLAVGLRVAHVLWMRASPYFDAPVLDGDYHVQWARALAAGREFQAGPYFRAPLYPWFLGLLQGLFGEGLLLPRLVQSLLGGATTWLTWRVGRTAFGVREGLLAALFMAVAWVPVHFDGELLIPTLFVPLVLLALWRNLRLGADASRTARLVVGALWGLSALARPNALLLVPVAMGVELLRTRRAAPALAMLAGVLLAIAPVTLVNRVRGGEWVLISSQAGVNLWIGNHPGSDGSTAIVPGTRGGWWEGFHDSRALAEAEVGEPLSASGVSRHYTRKVFARLAEDPLGLARHQLRKARLLWMDHELGNNLSVGFFARRYDPISRLRLWPWALCGSLAVVGWALGLRGGSRRVMLLAFPPVYAAGVVAFFVCSRYRLPLWPVCSVLAAHALVHGWACWRSGRRGPVLLGIVVTGLLVWTTRLEPPGRLDPDTVGEMELGLALLGRGDAAGALVHLERSTADPRHPFGADHGLARALDALGRADAALEHLRAALDVRFEPDLADLLARLLLRDQRFVEARAVAQDALARNPSLNGLRFVLGKALLQLGDDPGARAELERCREAPGLRFDVAVTEGVLHDRAGRAPEALEAYGRALVHLDEAREEAFVEQAFRRRSELLAGAGCSEEARACAEAYRAWATARGPSSP